MGKSAALESVVNKVCKVGYAIVNFFRVFNLAFGKSGFNNIGSRVHDVSKKHILAVVHNRFKRGGRVKNFYFVVNFRNYVFCRGPVL